MLFKPFRPPLLKKPVGGGERLPSAEPPRPTTDSEAPRPAKRRRLSRDEEDDSEDGSEGSVEEDDALNSFLDEAEGLPAQPHPPARTVQRPPRPKLSSSAFRKAHTAPKPALEDGSVRQISQSQRDDRGSLGQEVYFNALWRKVTNKKNKTWDGDGVVIFKDGIARLQDLSGRDMGRTKVDSPMQIGSLLTIHGREVEVESDLSKAEFLAGRAHLNVGAAKPTIKELETQMRTAARFNAVQTATSGPQTQKPAALANPASLQRPLNTAFKNPMLNGTRQPTAPRTASSKPVPRHDPNKDGALVMTRLKQIPSGKQVVDVVVDPMVSSHFRDHQRKGVQFMYECVMGMRNTGQGCILADEMGLGKTLQVIALIWTLLKQNPVDGDAPVVKKALIVCPATLIKNWRKEFRKWLGNERIGVFVVEDKARIRDFTHGKAYSVCIIGYEKLVKEQEQFQHGPGIDLVIADEGHRLKTATNKAAQAIKSLSTERRIVLSGTPLQNNLSEFYFTTDLVNPGILGKPGVFKRQFETPIVRGRQQDATEKEIEMGQARYSELAELTSQFLLRRTADILAKYLPQKTEYILFCKPTAAQASVYRSILSSPSFAAVLKASETSLQLINVLKKVCNSPNLLRQREDAEERDTVIRSVLSNIPSRLIATPGASGKLQVLDMLLHTIRTKTDEKVVLVSHYTATLDILGNLLTGLDYSFLRLDGSTPQSKRQGLVDKFNRTPQSACFAFLLSAKSGGAGLNLIGASRLILFDVDWNPSTDAQAMARIHRDGQIRPCRIYRLITRGALDEKIYQRQITKQGLADSVVDSKKDAGSAFSREELQQLFRLDETDHCQTHELLGCSCGGHGSSPLPASPISSDSISAESSDTDSESEISLDMSADDDDNSREEKSRVPSFTKSSAVAVDPAEREVLERDALRETKPVKYKLHAKGRSNAEGGKLASLMHYRHIDIAQLLQPSATSSPSLADEAAQKEFRRQQRQEADSVIGDAVLTKVLQTAENRISYVFAKTAGGIAESAPDSDVEELDNAII